jgi:hypothetical protein
MSKFIDRLNDVLHPAPQPMGFGRRVESKRKARVLLVAALDKSYADGVEGMVAGADGVILPVDSIPGEGEKTLKAVANAPSGEWLSNGAAGKLETIVKDNCDFVIFRPEKMGLGIVQYEKLGKVLEASTSIEDAILRTVASLPVDAVFVRHEGGEPSVFTFQDLMVVRHFAEFVGKPVMVAVTGPLTEKEILALWEAGVDAFVVATGPGDAAKLLKALRAELDKVTFPAQRRVAKKDAATVPHIAPAQEEPAKEEEEEEEEGDEDNP